MRAGQIHNDGDGLKLTLACKLCDDTHTTDLTLLEEKLRVDGKIFVYWARCPGSGHLILLRARPEGTIGLAFVEAPAGGADPKAP